MTKEMKNINVLNIDGSIKESIEIDIANENDEKSKTLISDVILMYMSNQHKRTACCKGRSDIAYSKRKQRKQKGTGRARAGHASSPIWVGGGVAFGPKPRDMKYEIPVKMRKLALLKALKMKIKDDEVVIVDEIKFDSIKTKQISDFVKVMKLDKGVKIITLDVNKNLVLSCRNIKKVNVINVENLNALEVVNSKKLLFSRKAFEKISEKLVA